MPTQLDEIRWSEPVFPNVPVPEELAADARRLLKIVPPYIPFLAPSPLLARLMLTLDSMEASAHLTPELVNVVSLVCSQENACRFCYGMQRAVMRMTGYSEERIRVIERDVESADEKLRAVVNFCRRLAQSNPRPAKAEREVLEKLGFSKEVITELAFEVACACFRNRVTTFTAAPLSGIERMATRWYSFLLRPFIARAFKPRHKSPVQEPATGPLAPIMEALNGTAAPPIFCAMAELTLGPSLLPHRSKLLMLATVARGLRCVHCEEACSQMLAGGDLTHDDYADILGALESPKLTELELKLLPYARDTIRYESYKMQERTAKLATEIGNEKALEAIGIAAMANMTVRLAMLLNMIAALVAAVTLALIAAIIAAVAMRRARAVDARLERAAQALEQLQTAFSRFAPASVVDQIVDRGVSTTAEKKEITVLFADLQGFTRMSETLDPVTLVEILNGYFERMSVAIRDHHGHVSKFMGDGLMALFGALESNPWQAKDAVEAALAMRSALEGYNVELKTKGLPELRLGIGIHHGEAVAGVIGSRELLEFTVIGDTVNVASRVEGLTRSHGVDILVTDPVRERLRDRFGLKEMEPYAVKGKSQPLRTFALSGRGAPPG